MYLGTGYLHPLIAEQVLSLLLRSGQGISETHRLNSDRKQGVGRERTRGNFVREKKTMCPEGKGDNGASTGYRQLDIA